MHSNKNELYQSIGGVDHLGLVMQRDLLYKALMKSLGKHILIDYFECNSEFINNKAFVSAALLDAARLSNATIVTDVFHTFNPHGISGVVVIAESHIAVHTWPEYACAAVDVFSCGDRMNPEVIEGFLKEVFQARSCESRVIERGRMLAKQDEPSVRESLALN